MASRGTVDDSLLDWNDISNGDWSGLLVGNGASIGVWKRFGYESLYVEATSGTEVAHPLTSEDQALFERMGTRNFEAVLSALATAEVVGRTLSGGVEHIRRRQRSIKRALLEAVRAVHVPWQAVGTKRLARIREALLGFETVYSTNYDLLIYWSIMTEDGKGFRDFFWSDGVFDVTNTEVWGKATRVLYLHGAIHLYRSLTGETLKRKRENYRDLLRLFTKPYREGASPLFVTEGTVKQKLSSIYRSDYLSFGYGEFASHDGPLVIFGHSLGAQDEHLIHAMAKGNPNHPIAISMLSGRSEEIMARKVELHKALRGRQLLFFDARTHPLGNPQLNVG